MFNSLDPCNAGQCRDKPTNGIQAEGTPITAAAQHRIRTGFSRKVSFNIIGADVPDRLKTLLFLPIW